MTWTSRRMRRCASILCSGSLALWIPMGIAALEADEACERQVEADWLRQDELREAGPSGERVTPEEDAAGGCDGVKDGLWGFHTEHEADPWWQVDLGEPRALDRMVLFNRCDGGFAARNGRIIVLLSDDGTGFRRVYQHDGSVFLGHSDGKPLAVDLAGARARVVRLQLPTTSYFHLDEVEVYSTEGPDNVALGKPATQSSVSQWSKRHARRTAGRQYSTAKAIERGLRLAASLEARGVNVDEDRTALLSVQARIERLPAEAEGDARRELYLEARRTVRRLALRNPLLDFDAILFAKAAPTRFPHMSDQFYGWWSRPGGGIFILEGFKDAEPRLRCLTEDLPEGSYLRPELSYDGSRILFAYCRYHPHVADLRDKAEKANVPEDAFYHIFEMNLDGSGRRQLTRGRYDDFEARYLPDGSIVFLSTRKGTFLQCTQENSAATTQSDLPDSYVRCGGDNYRPVPVFTLHAMGPDGQDLRPVSAFENFEWSPEISNDGQILYTRWDYIDRFNGHFFSLWSTRPDGTNPQLVYGNYTVRPQVVLEARPIPGSTKLVFTATAHHSITGGSLVLFDRAGGTEGDAPIERLTPEVPFPETEGWPTSYYASPWPLSEEHFLVAWSDRKLPPHRREESAEENPVNATGIYLYDAFGNLELLYRDPDISSTAPVPLRPRNKPPVFASSVSWDSAQEGRFLLQDVYEGLEGVPRGTVKSLRVIGVPPKTQPHMNTPNLGVSSEDPGKFLLGTAPVEEDGSAYFRAPSGIPVFFQAVDADGFAVQTMRSLTYVWPQQTQTCIGCHESREAAPPTTRGRPLAARKEPAKLTPGPSGSFPLRYDTLVQPVLDASCVSCHRPDGNDPEAAELDLTPSRSYEALLTFGDKDLHQLAFERDRSLVGEMPARRSQLAAVLMKAEGHAGTKLDRTDLERLVLWMDLYAQRSGHFSPEQEAALLALRRELAPMLEE